MLRGSTLSEDRRKYKPVSRQGAKHAKVAKQRKSFLSVDPGGLTARFMVWWNLCQHSLRSGQLARDADDSARGR